MPDEGYSNVFSLYYQIKLPLAVGKLILTDKPVCTLSTSVTGMELSSLYQIYSII